MQDWREKYIHENYSRMFEEQGHIVEQVRDSSLAGWQSERFSDLIGALVVLSRVQTSTGSQPSLTRCVTIWWRPWSIMGAGPRGQTRWVRVFDHLVLRWFFFVLIVCILGEY